MIDSATEEFTYTSFGFPKNDKTLSPAKEAEKLVSRLDSPFSRRKSMRRRVQDSDRPKKIKSSA